MKILIFSSGQSSLSHLFKEIFKYKTQDVEIINYLDFVNPLRSKLFDKSGKLPNKFEKAIRKGYIEIIQSNYLNIIKEKKPDLIFLYNDQMLLPETLDQIDKRIKIGMFLADSPLFLQKREHIVGLVRKVDAIFAPDTYWIDQCKLLGAKKIEYLIPGYNSRHHSKIKPSEHDESKYKCDVFFMGSPYPYNWGYKRALFLSKFSDFDFKLIGPADWKDWFKEFPQLEKNHVLKTGYLSDDTLNVMMNCSKINPVDANPGIINGVHIRAFDCIASGTLPLIEYRKDIDSIFKETNMTFIKNYDDIPEITSYYLSNTKLREDLIDELRIKILNKFNPKNSLEIISRVLDLD